jgi:hypothetical protein
MAERAGFEPAIPFGMPDFESHSWTHAVVEKTLLNQEVALLTCPFFTQPVYHKSTI